MFSNNSRNRDEQPGFPPSTAQRGATRGQFSIIGPDMAITGNVTATADLHVDGRIDGDVHCGSLVQGTDSQVRGQVRAETARLAGAVEGGVAVRELTVEKSARINGDVEYETISIENGAQIHGHLKHVSPGARGVFAPPSLPAPDEDVAAA